MPPETSYILQIQRRFGRQSVCVEVFFDSCAEEGGIDQEIKGDWSRSIEHRLRIEDLGKAISSYICKLSVKTPSPCGVGVLRTGRDEELPLPRWQLNVGRISDEMHLDLSLPTQGCDNVRHHYIHRNLGVVIFEKSLKLGLTRSLHCFVEFFFTVAGS